MSVVSSQGNLQLQISAQATQLIGGIASFPGNFSSLIQLAMANGTGAAKINQFFATQVALVQGTNQTFDLYTMDLACGTAPKDFSGKPYTMACLKLLVIQNCGVTPVESDDLNIIGTGAPTTLTTLLLTNSATNGLIIPGPVNAAAVSAGLSPAVIFFEPGLGYTVASGSGANILTLANTVGSGTTMTVNLIAVGSTA